MKMKTIIRATRRSSGGAFFATTLIMAVSAQAQNLFVGTYNNPATIYQITPGGVVSSFASTGLNYSYGLAFNSAGNLFVANCLNDIGVGGYVTEITPGGVQSTIPSGPDPKGLAFNSAGDLFETDYHSGNIYKYTPGGVLSIFATVMPGDQSLAFNSAGDLFAGSGYGNGNESIIEIKPNGTQITFASGLAYIAALAFNSSGDLFESDAGSGNIYKFSPDGMRTTFASGLAPNGLAFNSAGDLFEADASGNIYEFTPGGVRSTFASGLGSPNGVAFQGETLPVPEPATLGLLAAGMFGMTLFCRRQR